MTARRKKKAVKKSAKKPAKKAAKPIELYYWPTPNGQKITIVLEEMKLPYVLKPVNIGKGEQFAPGFPQNLAQQPHAGDRRPRRPGRTADLGLRIRRHPAISGPQERQALSRGRTRQGPGRGMAVLAGGRPGSHGGAGQPLPQLIPGRPHLCQEALHRRGASPVRGDEQAAGRAGNSWPAPIPSPTWPAGAGCCRRCISSRWTNSPTSRPGRSGWRRARR